MGHIRRLHYRRHDVECLHGDFGPYLVTIAQKFEELHLIRLYGHAWFQVHVIYYDKWGWIQLVIWLLPFVLNPPTIVTFEHCVLYFGDTPISILPIIWLGMHGWIARRLRSQCLLAWKLVGNLVNGYNTVGVIRLMENTRKCWMEIERTMIFRGSNRLENNDSWDFSHMIEN